MQNIRLVPRRFVGYFAVFLFSFIVIFYHLTSNTMVNPPTFFENALLYPQYSTFPLNDKNESTFFKNYDLYSQLVIWSSDFHISPIADIKNLINDYKVKIIDKSLSNHCHLTNSCAEGLDIINRDNGISLQPCPNKLKRLFYDYYKNNDEFTSASAYLCTHACSMCELYMPFLKPLIIIASTRFEIGRHSTVEWQEWINNLQRISTKPDNIIAANNRYDYEYIRYFTNITNILLLPNYCGYITDTYQPKLNTPFLLAPARNIHPTLYTQLKTLANKSQIKLSKIRELYPHFKYSDLIIHPAIILLPYQVSFMSFFEYYRMEIPMFIPTPELLTDWHLQYHVLNERTWSTVFGTPSSTSLLPKHINSTSSMQYDPNNEFNRDAILEWLLLSDFYQWPHIIQFHSFQNLIDLLKTTNLKNISIQMKNYNRNDKLRINTVWNGILSKILMASQTREKNRNSFKIMLEYDDVLKSEYSIALRSECIGSIPI